MSQDFNTDHGLRLPDFDHPDAAQIYAERVLVTGDRDWDDPKTIARELNLCVMMKVLIHGKCPTGADKQADEFVRQCNRLAEDAGDEEVEILPYPANWTELGRAAGPIRNRQMQREGKPDFVLAFHQDLNRSKGTKDMVGVARKAGIPVKIVTGLE